MSTTTAVKVSFFTVHGEYIGSQRCAGVPRVGDCVRLFHIFRVDIFRVEAVVWIADSNDTEGVLQPHITLTPSPSGR